MRIRVVLSAILSPFIVTANAWGQAQSIEATPALPPIRAEASPVATPSLAAPLPPSGWPQPPSEAPPRKLGVGAAGFFRPGLLLQGWFLMDHAAETASTFRIRRAELHVLGEIVPRLVSYELMIDPAKVLEFRDTTLPVTNQDPPPSDPAKAESVFAKQPVSAVSVLQDFFITYRVPYADVSVGQFKIPVSWEGFNSSSRLLFPERALVSKEFGDKRDVGLRLSKTFGRFGYSAGLFNGAGPNTLDTNNDKDVALRLEAYPVEGVMLGGVIYASVGSREANVKDRYEADLRFDRGPVLFQAEYIRARDIGNTGPAVGSQGFYGAVAWTFFGLLQPCLRVGFLDPDLARDLDPAKTGGKDEVWHFDAGLNYFVRNNEAKIQLAYSRLQYEDRTPTDEVILASQISF